ncbi:1-(5-phosphoribosyl)-5-[(5-phosphoribosylamino)methylideneamino]imidazole-4-carboxamide isomerase [Sporolactobacillus laevolacticus]|uniref:1-(5-phosphoribosyl)-5-[(5-phosphoribosylamino)methylideneamino] imidazole-4-carboxamide isomerase n=1 Tax=Sporolactobacillus laevolacticus DSM 442 TaxID=1395513 RepID=V6J2X9_9BACL|nr:1-(5-phosphoribosyl)-5-[(5-phosphoribosylamino)methylideneamino]imidazole-4-carboxamide isomerase [Sporolactobacillus laevolacticus]EST13566.1 1-(5-phosphoribosyl)-5-[(5-phosphoribosylamino)methylideneamino] imidazole-4-carboxamide isomerase [Sporolactobacillus laevolacticus DSM 442]
MFTVYPAIDLIDGKCVRLFQGDYDQSTVYGDAPVDIARSFYEQGAEWIHVVDLDGAKAGHPVNQELIARIAAEVPINIEVGGGIRTIEIVESYLNQGIKRVILGSSAISDPEFCRLALQRYPDSIAIGLDVKDGKVAVRGWLEVSDMSAAELAKQLIIEGAEHFIYTDISRDGALKGANVSGAEQLADEIGKPVVVSGGVTTFDEVQKLVNNKRVSGAIIGKALYTKQISLGDVMKAVKN